MKRVQGGVQVSTDDIELKRQLFMPKENFAKFNEALGVAADLDPIEAARAAVSARKNREVEELLDSLSSYRPGVG